MGHPGRDRTTSLITEHFYWPRMRNDIQRWIEECDRCMKFNTPTNQKAALVNIQTSFPLELVCMDYLTIEPCKGGVQNILVMTDHFTKFTEDWNQTAKTTADVFFNNFVIPYGLPTKIHSDQGANFMSKLLQELCSLTGISKSRTTPYHPPLLIIQWETASQRVCFRYRTTNRETPDDQKEDAPDDVIVISHEEPGPESEIMSETPDGLSELSIEEPDPEDDENQSEPDPTLPNTPQPPPKIHKSSSKTKVDQRLCNVTAVDHTRLDAESHLLTETNKYWNLTRQTLGKSGACLNFIW
ncbi:uncharacterized protein LOC130051105 [Ostrea edulis]|uniref:uncharacterized protein LOC130051105 n=1 Tax=Ostrea edulis TaxID=37623 RepID=UPI0024AF73AA|nr:uncharacterized protein LOC130051105 [Ostrea edulis]